MKILRRFYTSLFLAAALTTSVVALPEGASVQAGSVNIQSNGSTQTITQSSDRAIINWNGFNIDVGELVHFIQPNSISAILNRVVGQDPSQILGSMRANGQVFLINPNGVVFGPGANIDVGSLVVSTLDIADDDFMAGRLEFEQQADKDLAGIINHGTIKIDSNGFLVLTGPMVANEGIILAKVGQVALAGGTKSTISFDPTGLIQVELPGGSQSTDGIVSVSQGDVSSLLSSVVTTSVPSAGQIVERNGKTYLEVASGTVVNTGEIRADGIVSENAGRVILNSEAHTILAGGSVVSAAGQGADSSGGEIYVLSQGSAVSQLGSLLDASSGDSGNGGFVEQSSKVGFVGTRVDVSAPAGEAGTFLIDPERITVQTGAGGGIPPANTVYVSEDTIEAFGSGIFTLMTEDGVDFEALNGGDLTLMPDVDLNIVLTAGDGTDAITFANPSDTITLSGMGNFAYSSVTGTDVRDLKVSTESGFITLDFNPDAGSAEGGSIVGNSSFSTLGGLISVFEAVDVGSSTQAVTMEGDVSLLLSGDAFITNTGTTNFFSTVVDNLNASGNNYGIVGTLDTLNPTTTSNVTFNLSGNLSEVGTGTIRSATSNITADTINIRTQVPNLTVTGNDIAVRDNGTLNNLVATNLAGGPTDINESGEGAHLIDSMGEIRSESFANVTYVTTGSKYLDFIGPFGNLNITTTGGSLTGDIFAADGNLSLTAESIDVQSNDLGIVGAVTLVTTVGDANFTGNAASPDLFILANSAGDVNINNSGQVITPGGPVSSGLVGNTVNVTGASLLIATDATSVNATSTSGDVAVSHRGVGTSSISVDTPSGLGTVDITGTNGGDVVARDINGSVVTFSGTLRNVTSETGTRINGSTAVSITNSGLVDVDTTTDSLNVSAGGSVSVDNLQNFLPDLTALISAPGQTVDLTTDGNLIVSNVTANQANLTAFDIMGTGTVGGLNATATNGSIDFTLSGATVTVDANAVAGNIDLTTDAAFLLVGPTGISAGNDVSIFSSGGSIAGAGSTIATGSGGTARLLGGLISVDTESEDIFAEASTGSVFINNTNAPDLSIQAAATGASGNVTVTTDGNMNVRKLYSANGNISATAPGDLIATTDPATIQLANRSNPPGNTVAAPNGMVTLQGSSVTANVTTNNLAADALNGDALIVADGGPLNVNGLATNGTFDIFVPGRLTGNIAANVVDVTATGMTLGVSTPTLDVTTLGNPDQANATITSTQTGPMSFSASISSDGTFDLTTGGTASGSVAAGGTTIITADDIDVDIDPTNVFDLTALSGNIDVTSSSSNTLTGTATAGGNVNVSNFGSFFTTSPGLVGVGVTVRASEIAANIQAEVVDAEATSAFGNVDLIFDQFPPTETQVRAVSAAGGGDVTIQTNRNLILDSIQGNTVSIQADTDVGIRSANPMVPIVADTVLINSGPITGSGNGNGNGVVAVTRANVVDVFSERDVTVTNQGQGVLSQVQIVTTNDNIVVQNDRLLDLTATGNSVTATASGISAVIDAGSVNLNATAGDVFVELLGPSTQVVGSSTYVEGSFFDIISSGNVVVGPGGVTAESGIDIETLGGSVTSVGEGRLRADVVSLLSDAVEVDTEANLLRVESLGDIGVDNFNTPNLVAVLGSFGTGNVRLTTDGGLSIPRAFALDGNINLDSVGSLTATADPSLISFGEAFVPPGNTLAAAAGSITLDAASIDANVTTSSLTATTQGGNIRLFGNDNTTINITADAMGGNVDITETADVAGSINGAAVDIFANSLNIDLGTSVTSIVLDTDGDSIARGTSASFTADVFSDVGDVVLSNIGDIGVTFVLGDNVTLTATNGDITPNGFLGIVVADTQANLSGDNVFVQVDAPVLTATADVGSVGILAPFGPLTVGGSAVDTFSVNNSGGITTQQINATTIDLFAGGSVGEGQGGQEGPPRGGGPSFITRGTGSLVADNILLESETVDVVTEAANFDVNTDIGGSISNSNRDVTSLVWDNFLGDVSFTNTGNISGVDVSSEALSITAQGGAITGMIDALASATIDGDSFDLDFRGNTIVAQARNGAGNLDADTEGLDLSGQATGDLTVSNIGGDIIVRSASSGTRVKLDAFDFGDIRGVGQNPTAFISAPVVDVTGLDLNVQTDGGTLIADGVRGNAVLAGSGASLTVTASANGDISIGNSGDIVANGIQGTNVAITTTNGGSVSHQGVTRISSDDLSVQSDGNIDLDTVVSSLTGNAQGNIVINNFSAAVDPVNLTAGGDLSFTSSGTANIQTFQGVNLALDIASSVTGSLSGQSISVRGTDINLDVTANSIDATSTSGDITLTGNNPTLAVAANANNGAGNVSLSNGGNLVLNAIEGNNIFIDANMGTGAITQSSGQLQGNSAQLNGSSVSVNTALSSLTVTATGDVAVNNTSAALTPTISTAGNVTLTQNGGALTSSVVTAGPTAQVTGTGAVDGSFSAGSVILSGQSVSADVAADSVQANATGGNVSLTSNGSDPLQVGDSSATGNFALTHGGAVELNNLSGASLSVTANGGSSAITQASGRVSGGSAQLTGSSVNVDTTLSSLTVNATGNVNVSNNSVSLTPTITTGGAVNLNSTAGDITSASVTGGPSATVSASGTVAGSFSADSVTLDGQSVSANINTGTLRANASAGDATLTSSGTDTLRVEDSSASGTFDLTHGGDVEFTSITGTQVNITAADITDVSGQTIIASGITLDGNTIFVNTQGQIIVVTAQGDVTISNSVVDVDSLTIDSQGNVSFNTTGNLIVNQVAGLNGVTLSSGGNIGSTSGSFVSGPTVSLLAGGSITPNPSNALTVQASNSISIQASGTTIAAAINGSIDPSAVTVVTPSGPVFYNGKLLNGEPAPPPSNPGTPPPIVVDTLGQQSGEVVDDGSVGSAANDGIVEQSPTQKLVAQLTEAAEGGGEGGLTTEYLVTLEVDELGEVQVKLTKQSPFDKAINESEDMTADDVMDLDTEELTDVKIAVYYDAANDQIILAVDLRADDIMDLDVSDYQEIPVNLNYSFLSDPKLTLENLRLDDIIDLDVEDLGNIPIRVHVEGQNDPSASR